MIAISTYTETATHNIESSGFWDKHIKDIEVIEFAV